MEDERRSHKGSPSLVHPPVPILGLQGVGSVPGWHSSFAIGRSLPWSEGTFLPRAHR